MNNNYKILENTITEQGNTISLLGFNNKKSQTLIIGVVHGDEPQGEYLINRYLSENIKEDVLFIPCLNPDGKTQETRTNSNGVDLNRNFPTKNWEHTEKDNYYGGDEPASEIETKFLVKIIDKYNPKTIISLHTPYKIVNYDGPAKELAKIISEIIKYPVEASIGYPTPGSFGTYAGIEKNIPTITLEMDEECPVEDL
jgi:protein MpaA